MSNQVEQIRGQIEGRFWGAGQPLYGEEVTEQARQLLDFIDSLPKEDGPKKPYFDKEYIESKIKAFSEAHKGETAEQIEAECRGEEVPIEVCGKKVVVRYVEGLSPCPPCVFYEEGCTCLEYCRKFDRGGETAYFVEAEQPQEKDYKKLYEELVNSEWYKKYYQGASVGGSVAVEQPEADLEAEIDSYWKKVTGYQPPFAVLKLKMKDVAKIARHFAEWGAEHLRK